MRINLRLLTAIASLGAFVGIFPMSGDSTHAAYPGTNGRIAFTMQTSGEQHVWTMDANGGNRVQLTDGNSNDYTPAWSPDGTEVVYRANYNGGGGGLRIATYGSNDDDGIQNTVEAFLPSWSPDGTKIVYEADLGEDSDIVVINRNGTGRADLTNTPELGEYSPAFSPDGSKIAYVAGDDLSSDIWMMNADGSGSPTQITETATASESDPDFSPDGQSLVFSVSPDDGHTYHIARINVNKTGYLDLTDDPLDVSPGWSPDGTRIVFQRFLSVLQFGAEPAGGGGGNLYHIVLIDPDGDNPTDISPPAATSDFTPDWQSIPPEYALTWGDNNCSGARNPFDALATLVDESGIEAAGCPNIGSTLETDNFGNLLWGDLDCSHVFDPPDVLLLLRDAAGLPPANLDDCPALGIEIVLATG